MVLTLTGIGWRVGDCGTARPGAHAHGAIGHLDCRNAEALDRRRLHPAGAGKHGRLFFERHAVEQVGDALIDGKTPCFCMGALAVADPVSCCEKR